MVLSRGCDVGTYIAQVAVEWRTMIKSAGHPYPSPRVRLNWWPPVAYLPEAISLVIVPVILPFQRQLQFSF
jgi:hypothetical protein